jgi:trehalose 6-phosphate synthase
VLSNFAGAANELDAALLVNPHDIDGMAHTIAMALSMPLNERRMRYEIMMTKLRRHSIQQWFTDFLDALQDGQAPEAVEIEPLPAASARYLTSRLVSSSPRYH